MPEDDGHLAWRLIHKADILITGSPTYYGNISGTLKLLFNRTLTAFEYIAKNGTKMPIPHHKGKKAVLITTGAVPSPYSENINHGGGAINALRNIINAGGYDKVTTLIVPSSAQINCLTDSIKKDAEKIAAQIMM